MPPESFVSLPDAITLARDEVAAVLFALDVIDGVTASAEDGVKVRAAIRLLTDKLWPELGDLLDDEQ